MEAEKEAIKKKILNLDAKKASQNSDFLMKIVKKNLDIFCDFAYTNFNSSVKTLKFLGNLKLADITTPKKASNDIKGNYWPVGILPNLSNIFRKIVV